MRSFARRSTPAHRSRRHRFVVSCEHGGNRVPAEYARLFTGAARVLDSHRGLDYGALTVARAFGRALGVVPFTATVSRLVCDLNRSPGHRNLFSEYTKLLARGDRERVLAKHYWPYRRGVEAVVAAGASAGEPVLHVSAHSFTPALQGEVRRCDVGFLYDPAALREVELVDRWYAALGAAAPTLVLRRNYPYTGVSDALVTHLRRGYGRSGYLGVELEVNQKHVASAGWRALVVVLATTLASVAQHYGRLPR